MIIYCYKDANEVAAQAARLFVEAALDAVDRAGIFNAALSGGTTPLMMFEKLAWLETFSDDLTRRTHLYWGDERDVPNNDEDSNVCMARQALISPRQFPRTNIHAPNGAAENLELEALRYEIEIKRHVPLAANGFPSFDLILLGMGADGHTASLFPNTAALDQRFRTFVANDVPQLGVRRLTMTVQTINTANYIMMIVTGEQKADVLKDVFALHKREPEYPIDLIKGSGSNLIWLADEAAISKFSPEQREYYSLQ
ncbi:6-phosphogluconolactonase [bacterium]|nr:6-phosphogluconolactonase [bacterium]